MYLCNVLAEASLAQVDEGGRGLLTVLPYAGPGNLEFPSVLRCILYHIFWFSLSASRDNVYLSCTPANSPTVAKVIAICKKNKELTSDLFGHQLPSEARWSTCWWHLLQTGVASTRVTRCLECWQVMCVTRCTLRTAATSQDVSIILASCAIYRIYFIDWCASVNETLLIMKTSLGQKIVSTLSYPGSTSEGEW